MCQPDVPVFDQGLKSMSEGLISITTGEVVVFSESLTWADKILLNVGLLRNLKRGNFGKTLW